MLKLDEVGIIHLKDVIGTATEQLESLLGLEASRVIAAFKGEDGWRVTIELVERKAVPDTQDLLGTYDVVLNDVGEMVSYERTRVRRRMDLEESIE